MALPGALRSTGLQARSGRRHGIRSVIAALCLTVTSAACTAPRLDVPRPFSEAWLRPEETALGREFGKQLAGHPGQSGFYLLSSGMDAFSMRAGLAQNAQRTLDLQYYIVSEDTTTQLLLYRGLSAAQRGVRVRLLVDDLYALGKDFDLATFAAHSNIEVRVFNPFMRRGALGVSQLLEFLGDSARLNRRMHNKLWIADNAAAIVGGRNLGDEYFDAHGEANFADLDVLAAGPVVRDISRSFDDYWNSEWAVPIEAFVANPPDPTQLAEFEHALETRLERFRDTDYARVLRETRLGFQLRSGQLPLVPAPASVLYDKPAKISDQSEGGSPSPLFSSHVRPVIEAAQREVILISPYFIPNEQGIGVLNALARRGVRVRILTNSLASADYVPLAHAGYAAAPEPVWPESPEAERMAGPPSAAPALRRS